MLCTEVIGLNEPVDIGVIENFLHSLPEAGFHIAVRVLLAVLAFVIGMQIIRFLRKIFKKTMNRRNVDVNAIRFTDSFLKFALYFLLITGIASSLGVDAASIVAILGSAGVAIGLALQGSLSNLAGGVLLLMLKPFVVGDYIQDSKQNMGTVTAIDLFYSELTTADHKIISLPNGTLANGEVINFTRCGKRRIDLTVNISYDADIQKAKEVLMQVLQEETLILPQEERLIYVQELADSAIIIGIRCWVNSSDYVTVMTHILEPIKYALDAAQIKIPYPQLDIHTI